MKIEDIAYRAGFVINAWFVIVFSSMDNVGFFLLCNSTKRSFN